MRKCSVFVGAVVFSTWIASAQDVPKFGAYIGYDYVRFNSAGYLPAFSANGAGTQLIVNFGPHFSALADLGAVHNGNIGGVHTDTTVTNFLFGPRFNVGHGRVVPYFQILWGGVYAATSTQIEGVPVVAPVATPRGFPVIIPGQPITLRVNDSQTAFAMTAGGGLDIKLNKHLSFRPIGLDYYLTRLQNHLTGIDNNQSNLRYSVGLTFLFGGEKPAPKMPPAPQVRNRSCPDGSIVSLDSPCPMRDVSMTLAATPSTLCPGEIVRVVPTVAGGVGDELRYTWSINGQQSGEGSTFDFATAGRQAGTYTVGLATNGAGFNPGSAETTVTIRDYRPPTGTVSARPAEIRAGDRSALASDFQGQCGGPIQAARYEASEGSIVGDQFDSSSVQFDTSNPAEQKKTVTITAKASDNQNVGTATTTIEVVKAAAPVAAPVRLPDVLFTSNSSRVNNCGKRILLEQLRAYYERDPNGTVAIVGHNSSDEKAANLAQQRAMNAAAVVSAGTGVCLSIPQAQVQVSAPGTDQNGVAFESGFCQSSVGAASTASSSRRVEVWFVHSGGQLPSTVTGAQTAAAMSVGSLGCPK